MSKTTKQPISIIGPIFPFRGGITHINSLLINELENNDCDVQVISFTRQYPSWIYPGSSDKDPSYLKFHTDGDRIIDPFHPWTWWNTAQRIIRFNPALIIIHWWTTFWSVPFIFMNRFFSHRNKKVVYLVHNVFPHEQKFYDRYLSKLTLNRGNAFIVFNTHQKKLLKDINPNTPIELCPMPLYGFPILNKKSKIITRKILELPSKEILLLFFGFIRPYKGLVHLLNAMALLKERKIFPILIIAGEFWEDKSKYKKLINELNISSMVKIFDYYIPNEELDLFFSSVDIVVFPFTGGTWSASAALALGSGLPIIITEKIADGINNVYRKNSIIVPPGNPIALADSIENFVKNPLKHFESSGCKTSDWQYLVNVILKMANT